MERRRMRRKPAIAKRMMVCILSLVMVLSMFSPGLMADAEANTFLEQIDAAYDAQTQSGTELGSLALGYVAQLGGIQNRVAALDPESETYAADREALLAEAAAVYATADAARQNGEIAEADWSNVTAAYQSAVGVAQTGGNVVTEGLTNRTVYANVDGKNFAVTGKLPENATLSVKELDAELVSYIRTDILGLGAVPAGYTSDAYDISLMADGVEIQPAEAVSVAVTAGGITPKADVAVYHLPGTSEAAVNADNASEAETTALAGQKVENVNVADGYFGFYTGSFSVYYMTAGNLYADVDDVNPVDALFERLMAAATYEELDAMMEAMTEEEYELLNQFTDEQNDALTARVAELSENAAETLDTVTVDQVLDTYTGSGQTSRVYLAVRRDGNIPGEPSVQGSAAYNFYNSNYSTGGMLFANNPTGIIDQNIVDYQNFILTSVDGTDTAGLVDGSGTTTNQVLSGIDFDRLLNAIVNSRNVTATDGQTVTSSNKENYKVVCYVIKLQLDENHGWHIDCAVVPKTYVTLSYDINIPDGYVITTSGVGVPNSETGSPPATFDVGGMSGLKTIEGQANAINVESANGSEKYVFMFQGWNTKADGSGEWYQPNSTITINENTVLYAIWNSNPALGTGNLEIQKIVNADAVPVDATFTFQVTINNADGSESSDTYNYTVYNANTIAESRGTISNGGTITLKHEQYAEIRDLPAVNDDNGKANVTVKEINYSGYVPSWDGGATVSDTTSVTVQGGRDSRVTCTNSVVADDVPDTAKIKIEKNFVGLTATHVPDDFQIQLMQNGQAVHTLTKSNRDASSTDLHWVWTIDAPVGDYTLTEQNAEVTNFDLSASGLTGVSTTPSTLTFGDIKNIQSNNNKNINFGQDVNFFVIKLTANGGTIVWTKDTLTQNQRQGFINDFTDNSFGLSTSSTVFFSGTSILSDENGLNYKGGSVKLNTSSNELIFDLTSQWTFVGYGQYSIISDSAEHSVTNTYNLKVSKAKVTKTVTGNMSDQNKEFSFTASVVDGSMNNVTFVHSNGTEGTITTDTFTFTLKHNEWIEFDGLTIGSQLKVVEAGSAYTVYVDDVLSTDCTGIKEVESDGSTTIAFTNTNQVDIDTGIEMTSYPFILMLSFVTVAGLFFLIGKRRMMF